MNKNILLKYIFILAILYILFVIFLEFIYNSLYIKNIDNELSQKIETAYELNLAENEKIKHFKFNALFMDCYFVIKIEGVENIEEFLNRNTVIQTSKKDSIIHIYPRIKHIPIGNQITCFYRGENIYISVYNFTGAIGPNVSELFWAYYKQ